MVPANLYTTDLQSSNVPSSLEGRAGMTLQESWTMWLFGHLADPPAALRHLVGLILEYARRASRRLTHLTCLVACRASETAVTVP
jgi:hypothetical protein